MLNLQGIRGVQLAVEHSKGASVPNQTCRSEQSRKAFWFEHICQSGKYRNNSTAHKKPKGMPPKPAVDAGLPQ